MNKDQFQGNWKQLKGKIKEKWGKLTDDEITEINGKREILLGKLQNKYGLAKERAEEELSQFEKHVNLTETRTPKTTKNVSREETYDVSSSPVEEHVHSGSGRTSHTSTDKSNKSTQYPQSNPNSPKTPRK